MNVVWVTINNELEGSGSIDPVYLSVMLLEEVPDVLPLTDVGHDALPQTDVGHDALVRLVAESCKEPELKTRTRALLV